MGRNVVIFGTGDFARIAACYLEQDSPHTVAAFTAHAAYIKEPQLLGKPVVPFEELLRSHPPAEYDLFVAVGFKGVNKARAEVFKQCEELGYEFITYVHSGVKLIQPVKLGRNVFIFENNVVQPFVEIGDDAILWSGNHIGHDSTIGEHCFISSHVVVSGHCKVGPYCFLGVNATLRDGLTLGEACVVGAGALILKDAEARSVFKGTPSELAKITSDRLRM